MLSYAPAEVRIRFESWPFPLLAVWLGSQLTCASGLPSWGREKNPVSYIVVRLWVQGVKCRKPGLLGMTGDPPSPSGPPKSEWFLSTRIWSSSEHVRSWLDFRSLDFGCRRCPCNCRAHSISPVCSGPAFFSKGISLAPGSSSSRMPLLPCPPHTCSPRHLPVFVPPLGRSLGDMGPSQLDNESEASFL